MGLIFFNNLIMWCFFFNKTWFRKILTKGLLPVSLDFVSGLEVSESEGLVAKRKSKFILDSLEQDLLKITNSYKDSNKLLLQSRALSNSLPQ